MATKAFGAADAAVVDPALCARGHECKPTEVLNLTGRGIAVIGSLGPIGTTAAPLRRLNLSDNSLTRLTGLHHLPSLTWLDASKNKLVGTALSDLDEMRALVVLSAAHNALKDLPASALRAQASSLKALVLNNNSLRDKDITPLLALTQLNSLVLSHNPRITSLPEAISRLRELTKLSLSHCTLTALPSGIGSLTRLAELRLNGNALTAVPPALAGCRGLRLLDLGHNQIADLEGLAVLGELPMLANLNLRGNPCCPVGRGGPAARAAAEGSADDVHAAAADEKVATAAGTAAGVPASAEEIEAYSAALLALCPRLSHLDNQKLARREGQKGGASSRAAGKTGAGAAAGSAHRRAAAAASGEVDEGGASRGDEEEDDEAEAGASAAPPTARPGGKAARGEPGAAARDRAAGKARVGSHDSLRAKGGARTTERPEAAAGGAERKHHGRESSSELAHARAGAGAAAAPDVLSGSKRKRAEITGHASQRGKGAGADGAAGPAAEAVTGAAMGGKRARLAEATGAKAGGHLDDHAAPRGKSVHLDKRDAAGQAEGAAVIEGEGKAGQGASRSERRRSKVEQAGLVDKAHSSGSGGGKASRSKAAADAGEGDAQVEYVSASSHSASKAAADSAAPGGDFAALVKGQEGVDVVGGWD